MNFSIGNLLKQFFYIQNRKMCLNKTILYHTLLLLTCLGQLLLWTHFICNCIALSEKREREGDQMLFKNCWGSFGCWWTWAYLSVIFIKVQELQIVLRDTQTLEVLIFFRKKFCLMSDLKFTLSGVTSFLPDYLSELKKIIVRPEAITGV